MLQMSNQNPGRMELIRKAGNIGRFYPSDAEQIRLMFKKWELICQENALEFPHLKPEAVVCPHAGYVYSGFTAYVAHRLLPRKNPQRVLVVGPSHHVFIEGMSLGVFDAYETPFGLLKGDRFGGEFLTEHFDFNFSPYAHGIEHSTETQFPFIKFFNPDIQILELIYGNVSPAGLKNVIKTFMQLPGSVVVISTDLSHYYTQEQANRLDSYCLESLKHKDLYLLEKGCEACGKTGLGSIIDLGNETGWKAEILDYRTSGDVTGDYSAVVGYMSAVFYA